MRENRSETCRSPTYPWRHAKKARLIEKLTLSPIG